MKTTSKHLSHQQPDSVVITLRPRETRDRSSRFAVLGFLAALAFATGAGAVVSAPVDRVVPAIRGDGLQTHVPMPSSLAARGFYRDVYR